jgi:hypothetical protein
LKKSKTEKKIEVPAPIAHMALLDPKDGQLNVAFGGKENALQVWDLQSNQMTWKSKNVTLLYFTNGIRSNQIP